MIPQLRLFKATVTVDGFVEEVPVWAADLDAAHDQAEAAYGEVRRIRAAVAPDTSRFEVTQ